MKIIQATVYESYYQDDYEQGEVDKTWNIVEVDERRFETIGEAVKWFKDTYEWDKDIKAELVDDFISCGRPLMMTGDYGFIPASESQIESWKRGRRDLWNVEYQLRLARLEQVDSEELKTACAGVL